MLFKHYICTEALQFHAASVRQNNSFLFGTQAVEAGRKVQELQSELAELYKRHSKQSEEFLQACMCSFLFVDSHIRYWGLYSTYATCSTSSHSLANIKVRIAAHHAHHLYMCRAGLQCLQYMSHTSFLLQHRRARSCTLYGTATTLQCASWRRRRRRYRI